MVRGKKQINLKLFFNSRQLYIILREIESWLIGSIVVDEQSHDCTVAYLLPYFNLSFIKAFQKQ